MLCLGFATYSAFMSLSGAAAGDLALLASFGWLLLVPGVVDGLEVSAGMSLSGALWFWMSLGLRLWCLDMLLPWGSLDWNPLPRCR